MSGKMKSQLETENAELRGQLALVDDAIQRVAFIDDSGQPVLQSHERMHKHHGQRPYIGCIFCRDEFGELGPIETLVDSLYAAGEDEWAEVLKERIAEARDLAGSLKSRIGGS